MKNFELLSSRQICITGANGFIGRELVQALSGHGCNIRVLTRKNNAQFPKGVEVVVGDLLDQSKSLTAFMSNCDIFFHCAGEINNVKLMKLLHIDGTRNLINAALNESERLNKRIHWVQLGSCGTYGPPVGPPELERIVTEESPSNPVNEYEITKTTSDELIIDACRGRGVSYSILRPSNVFGKKMTNQTLRKLIRQVKDGRFFFLGKAGSIATYVHVNDVVRAMLIIATDDRAKNEIYNISSDCTFEELIKTISSLIHVHNPLLRLPAPIVTMPLALIETLLKKWIRIPRIDMLMSRTRYPSRKIENELDFTFSMPMPSAIQDLTNEFLSSSALLNKTT